MVNIPMELFHEGNRYQLNIDEGRSGITTCIYELVPKNDEYFLLGSHGETFQKAVENMRKILIKENLIKEFKGY